MSTILAIAALASSILLLTKMNDRVLPFIAMVVSGLEVAMAFGWVSLAVAKVPLALVFAVSLALTGGLTWLRASSKTNVSAATIIAVVGVVQVLAALRMV